MLHYPQLKNQPAKEGKRTTKKTAASYVKERRRRRVTTEHAKERQKGNKLENIRSETSSQKPRQKRTIPKMADI